MTRISILSEAMHQKHRGKALLALGREPFSNNRERDTRLRMDQFLPKDPRFPPVDPLVSFKTVQNHC